MQGDNAERSQQLCALAAVEQDPERLLELVTEINRLLAAKEQRLQELRRPPGQPLRSQKPE